MGREGGKTPEAWCACVVWASTFPCKKLKYSILEDCSRERQAVSEWYASLVWGRRMDEELKTKYYTKNNTKLLPTRHTALFLFVSFLHGFAACRVFVVCLISPANLPPPTPTLIRRRPKPHTDRRPSPPQNVP